jgi:regulator of CtrA degradation
MTVNSISEERGQNTKRNQEKPARSPEIELSILRFVASGPFSRLFKDGMVLVEETASYLDSLGRAGSKELPRNIDLAYAGESMRLTTRLMQVASWLLVHRAIEEGEISAHEAQNDKYRLGAHEVCSGKPLESIELLPERLRELLTCSEQMYDRVNRLDKTLYSAERLPSEFDTQLNRLHEAFGDGA